MFAAHSGPLPAVQDFSGYESVLPGAADRIMKMAETSIDAHHQTALADAELQMSAARSIDNRGLIERRQQIVFSAVTILALIGAFAMAWYGKTVPSVIAVIVMAAGGYAVFKTSRDGFKIYPTSEKDVSSRCHAMRYDRSDDFLYPGTSWGFVVLRQFSECVHKQKNSPQPAKIQVDGLF